MGAGFDSRGSRWIFCCCSSNGGRSWSRARSWGSILWGPDVFTDVDAGIHTAILRIRQVLGDSSASPRFVETVSGKGYRFIAPVEVVVLPGPYCITNIFNRDTSECGLASAQPARGTHLLRGTRRGASRTASSARCCPGWCR